MLLRKLAVSKHKLSGFWLFFWSVGCFWLKLTNNVEQKLDNEGQLVKD